MITTLALASLALASAVEPEGEKDWVVCFAEVDRLRKQYHVPCLSPRDRMEIMMGKETLSPPRLYVLAAEVVDLPYSKWHHTLIVKTYKVVQNKDGKYVWELVFDKGDTFFVSNEWPIYSSTGHEEAERLAKRMHLESMDHAPSSVKPELSAKDRNIVFKPY